MMMMYLVGKLVEILEFAKLFPAKNLRTLAQKFSISLRLIDLNDALFR